MFGASSLVRVLWRSGGQNPVNQVANLSFNLVIKFSRPFPIVDAHYVCPDVFMPRVQKPIRPRKALAAPLARHIHRKKRSADIGVYIVPRPVPSREVHDT